MVVAASSIGRGPARADGVPLQRSRWWACRTPAPAGVSGQGRTSTPPGPAIGTRGGVHHPTGRRAERFALGHPACRDHRGRRREHPHRLHRHHHPGHRGSGLRPGANPPPAPAARLSQPPSGSLVSEAVRPSARSAPTRSLRQTPPLALVTPATSFVLTITVGAPTPRPVFATQPLTLLLRRRRDPRGEAIPTWRHPFQGARCARWPNGAAAPQRDRPIGHPINHSIKRRPNPANSDLRQPPLTGSSPGQGPIST